MTSGMRRWSVWAGAGVLLLAGLLMAFWPQSVPVDFADVRRGPLLVTVDDDGETRVDEVYLVSAPISGRVLRLEGEVGDRVEAQETVLARLFPTEPTILDVRTRTEREAAVQAAKAAETLSTAELQRTQAELDFARAEFVRARDLAKRGTISEAALDRARKDLRAMEAAALEAEAALEMRRYERATAEASLIDPSEAAAEDAGDSCCLSVRAPVGGRILRILQESEGVVAAGAPLVEIGDPEALEIVVDLLSSDAVQVSEGDRVLIERWGGGAPLEGRVRRVEPTGFTKVSALGVEEQRVNVIIDFAGAPAEWARLGHGYRVHTRIVIWEGGDVLKAPLGALFRGPGGRWAAFAERSGRARLTPVEIGHVGADEAELLSGLDAGDRLVLHPSDRIAEGVRIRPR